MFPLIATQTTRGYSCEQIHKSIIRFLPRKHVKSQHLEITSRIYNEIYYVRMDNLVWEVQACGYYRVPGVSLLEDPRGKCRGNYGV